MINHTEPLSKEKILENIKFPCNMEVFSSIGSTNTYARNLNASTLPQIVIADRQTAGRGRMERTFESPAGTGLYMSMVFSAEADFKNYSVITMATAVAAAQAIETVSGIEVNIKWVNDLYYKKRKVAGILTEGLSDNDNGILDKIIIGIGINCFPGNFSDEIRSKAGFLSENRNAFSRNLLASEIANETFNILKKIKEKTFLEEYRRRDIVSGKKIIVRNLGNNSETMAKALFISDDGCLVVRYLQGPKQGLDEKLFSGEISLKL